MFENTYFFLFICLLFFGIGDVLGVATKAKLSSVFVSLFLFLIGFVTGIIPPDIIKVAGLSEMGKWATCFIVFSMGTTIMPAGIFFRNFMIIRVSPPQVSIISSFPLCGIHFRESHSFSRK